VRGDCHHWEIVRDTAALRRAPFFFAAKMKSFQDSINEALRSAFPSGHQPYSHVNVLAIKFMNDDLKVTGTEGNLCQVFDKTYHYGITKHVLGKNINPKDTDDDQDLEAKLELNNILSSFAINHGGKGCREVKVRGKLSAPAQSTL